MPPFALHFVHFIVTNVAKRPQVFLYVWTAFGVVLDVMQLEMSRIGIVPLLLGPTTIRALVGVTP